MSRGSTYDGEWVVSSLLDDRAERLGDRLFVTTARGDVTYAELRDRAQRLAGGLAGLGVAPGDRVATMLDPTLDYLSLWFGVVWAGAVDVPVNTAYRGEFLAHVLRESGAAALVVDRRWLDRLVGLDLPDLRAMVVVDSGLGEDDGPADGPMDLPGAVDLAQLDAADPLPRVPRDERDLTYVMFTSGTTGPSKGAMHSNRSALYNAETWIDICGLTDRDVAYSMFPLFHVTARSAIITASMWAGGSVVLRDRFTLSGFWDDIRATGATWFGYMGAVIHLLHQQPRRADDADNALRVAFGAAAPPAIIAAFNERFGLELLETYGSTELGPATAPRPGDVVPGTMGRPCDHLIVEVHDAADRAVPQGEAGEIVARPAVPEAMFLGYFNRPDATVEAFRNLWFHTGDRGRFDADGRLVFADRIKDSLRRRGENISSFEVERAVQAHPSVLEAAAYAVSSELTEDEVMIAVVPADGHEVDVRALLEHCVATMPRFAVPRFVRVVESLPKTPSQRIQKFLLREEGVTPDAVDREAMGVAVPRD